MTLDESLLHQKVGSESGKEAGVAVGAEANMPGTPDIEVTLSLFGSFSNPLSPKVGLLDLLKSPVLLPRLLVTYVNWTVINLCYYGLTMNRSFILIFPPFLLLLLLRLFLLLLQLLLFFSVNLSGDVFLNTLLGVLIEAPGYILAMCTMDR